MRRILGTFFFCLVWMVLCEATQPIENPSGTTYRILVGAPVYQKPAILHQFLESLKRQNQEGYTLDYLFIDDNDNDLKASSEMLANFALDQGDKCLVSPSGRDSESPKYECDEAKHHWKNELIWKVAGFKDRIIQHAREKGYDYLFLIDSDLVMHPKTIQQLIKSGKDIVSNIFWTAWTPGSIEEPQVWLSDYYTQYQALPGEALTEEQKRERAFSFYRQLRQPGTYEVGGLGACTLISKAALQKDISFRQIKNITFWGEDRHFCVRAAALGLSLFVDTHYPAYHIYRETKLEGVDAFVKGYIGGKEPRITLSMIMKNEASKHLKQMLENARSYISDAVIIDDGSEDNSIALALEVLKGIPVHLVANPESKFANEWTLRKQQWEETVKVSPEWILMLDADEIFEERFKDQVKMMCCSDPTVNAYSFRLYDMWDENHYRDDDYWMAHNHHRIFLIRYNPNMQYQWKETEQHCGRFPQNIREFAVSLSDLRLKHYGYANKEIRTAKYERYQKLDPEAKFGWKEQYESILDENPHLLLWTE